MTCHAMSCQCALGRLRIRCVALPLFRSPDNFREKNLRAALRSAVDRTLHTGAIVIADSNNFIKGFRYELWCAARAAKARYCLVIDRRKRVGVGGK